MLQKVLEKTFDRINTPQFFDFNIVDHDESDDNGYFEQERLTLSGGGVRRSVTRSDITFKNIIYLSIKTLNLNY